MIRALVRSVVAVALALAVVEAAFACASFAAAGGSTDASDDHLGTTDGDATTDTGTFCQQASAGLVAPLYCRDFDDGDPAMFGWDEVTVHPRGMLEIDTKDDVSAPASLRARLLPNTPDCAYARGIKKIPVAGSRVHVSFDVRIGGEGTAPAEAASFMVVGLASPTAATCILIMSSSASSGDVHEQFGTAPQIEIFHPLNRYPLPAVWTHLDVDINRGSRALDVRVDGKPAFATAQALAPACGGAAGSVFVSVGFHCEATGAAAKEIHVDNVLVTAQP